MFFYIFSYS